MSKVFTKCGRCNGRGHMMAYQNVAGGICFECKGTKGIWETKEAIARRAAAAKRAQANAQAKMQVNLDKMAPIHAVWEQRADLVVDLFEDIPGGALTSICATEEFWGDGMLWREAVANIRGNFFATSC